MRGLLIWQELVYGLILILAVMFMPRGIWGFIERAGTRQPATNPIRRGVDRRRRQSAP